MMRRQGSFVENGCAGKSGPWLLIIPCYLSFLVENAANRHLGAPYTDSNIEPTRQATKHTIHLQQALFKVPVDDAERKVARGVCVDKLAGHHRASSCPAGCVQADSGAHEHHALHYAAPAQPGQLQQGMEDGARTWGDGRGGPSHSTLNGG